MDPATEVKTRRVGPDGNDVVLKAPAEPPPISNFGKEYLETQKEAGRFDDLHNEATIEGAEKVSVEKQKLGGYNVNLNHAKWR